jgi:hypothetical protein
VLPMCGSIKRSRSRRVRLAPPIPLAWQIPKRVPPFWLEAREVLWPRKLASEHLSPHGQRRASTELSRMSCPACRSSLVRVNQCLIQLAETTSRHRFTQQFCRNLGIFLAFWEGCLYNIHLTNVVVYRIEQTEDTGLSPRKRGTEDR